MTQTEWFPVAGVKLAAIAAGIKKPNKKDLVVIELAEGSRAAGVFTTNRFQAAPVQVARVRMHVRAPKAVKGALGLPDAAPLTSPRCPAAVCLQRSTSAREPEDAPGERQ